MKLRLTLAISLLSLGLALVSFMTKEKSVPPTTEETVSPLPTMPSPLATPLAQARGTPLPMPTTPPAKLSVGAKSDQPLSVQIQDLESRIPSASADAALAEEAQASQHAPKVMMDWAFDLGLVMIPSLKDPQEARATYSFLKKCFTGSEHATAFRALCSANAKRIADRYPEKFSADFTEQSAQLPTTITSLIERLSERD